MSGESYLESLESLEPLTLSILAQHKYINLEMLPELVDFYNLNKNKVQKQQKPFKKHNKILKNQKNYNGKKHNNSHNNHIVPIALPPKKVQKTDDEQLYSEFRSILNKLTEVNFDVLSKDLLSLNISTKEHLVSLSNLIFKKAIVDKKFCAIYAKLVRYICKLNVCEENKRFFFRDILVSECQQTFNACISDKEISKDIATGCIRFIGDLYNNELLTNKIICSCFMLLLQKINNSGPNDYIIDAICDLFKTVGKIFITKCVQETEFIFQKIDIAIKSGKLCNKDRFALMDITDMKKANKF